MMIDETRMHERNIDSLIQRYGKEIGDEIIKDIYSNLQSNYVNAPIQQYLPILNEA